MIRQITPNQGHARSASGEETVTLTMKRQPVTSSLEKKNKRIGWSKRTVSLDLDDGKFVYSKKLSADESKDIQLKQVSSVRCKGRVLEINNDDGSRLEFRAATEVDAYSWMQTLNMAVTMAKALKMSKGFPSGKRSAPGLSLDLTSASTATPEMSFPVTPQSAFSTRSSGSLNIEFAHPRSASFSQPNLPKENGSSDSQNEAIKKLWERRTLLRRQSSAQSSCSSLNDSEGDSEDLKSRNSEKKSLASAVNSVKRNIVETSNQTSEQNNKMIAFFSGLISKILSPILQVFSKTVRNKEAFELLKTSGSIPSIVN
mmetsp:Transcript_13091/g.15887  ORF Transcript_13091/g.15887 Transcript_13091/m.15887 type:complete len:314 (-) Transcript_13091:96-1037(-)